MPVNVITPLSSGGTPVFNFPFKLTATTAKPGIGADMTTLDCACPCALAASTNITSSKLFKKVQTDKEKAEEAAKITSTQTKKAVIVARESYLFRGIYPSLRPAKKDDELSAYGTKEEDPILRVYGLDVPIVIEDFFNGENKDSKKTIKIWLTVCFPSGEIDEPTSFSSCAGKTDNDVAKIVKKADWRSLKPMVAFISYGEEFPKDLIAVKQIKKAPPAQNPPTPRVERRQVEAHVPIGEVGVSGRVVAQYVKTNLMLTDLCFNGTPAKYPMPMINGY